MVQNAAERPIPSVHRKAAIAKGGAFDHSGKVQIEVIENFDINRTIFKTLAGAAPRYVVAKRVGKEAHFDRATAESVEVDYQRARSEHPLPEIDPALLKFMVDECDFDVEHADGSFLDHLYFCFEYGVQHLPQHSALVLLLHSILGTGTNTFAMTAGQIPQLRALMDEFDWKHVEAFPSTLRLLYDLQFRQELRANLGRLDKLKSVSMFRVIDNEPIELSADDLWIQLNYQLIHLVDFLPVANWGVHQNDTSFIIFRDLYDLLGRADKRMAKIDYTPAIGGRALKGEDQSFGAWLTTMIPVSVSEKMAAKSVRNFSAQIGHSMEYQLRWS
jgi:hypothetical protein